jgi:hypothetical protein
MEKLLKALPVRVHRIGEFQTGLSVKYRRTLNPTRLNWTGTFAARAASRIPFSNSAPALSSFS